MKVHATGLTVYALYDHPTDYPDSFVVRGYSARVGGEVVPDEQPLVIASTLDEARAKLLALRPGLVATCPYPDDDPKIMEVWL